MKILYITQYFHPEIGATTNRAIANAKILSKKGHDVTILTEMPNHPKGIIFDGYRGRLFLKESMEGFFVHRVWVYTSPKKNFITRILFYLSFMFFGSISAIWNWRKYDVVYITSPPLFVAGIGILLKLLFRKTKIVFEVRDLWPDSAVELGELNNRMFYNLSLKLEKKIYNISEHIIAISNDMKSKIINKGYPESKISIIHNGTDLNFINSEKKLNQELITKFKTNNQFLCVYAGIIGIAQGLEVILKTAKHLENENINFLIIGSGPKLEEMKKNCCKLKLENVLFINQVSRSNVIDYLNIADAGIIPLRNLELFKGALPSKIFDYMACNLPILLGIKGEAKELIEKSNTGLYFEPENEHNLTEKISSLMNNKTKLEDMKTNGKKFVDEHFNREKLAVKLSNILENL